MRETLRKERGDSAVKQILKRILFITIISFGASLTTFAQRQEKPPPKKDPPIVVVPPKKDDKKDDKKNDDDKKPRRPQAAGLGTIQEVSIIFD